MIERYYLEELSYLRNIAKDFSLENPAMAPMLGEPCADPDVERLLEGVAFLTGAVRQKIDDEFPEIVHDLLRQIWPHVLRPLPSATLLAFSPGSKITETRRIPKGTFADSSSGTALSCRFTTTTDVDIFPLSILGSTFMDPPGTAPWIRVHFQMGSSHVASFRPGALRFHLGGGARQASELYHLLSTCIHGIRVQTDDGENTFHLDPENLEPCGFAGHDALLPWPTQAFEGFRFIQEYFLMPEKFLTFQLKGLDRWAPRSDSRDFHIDFLLEASMEQPVSCGADSFILFVTPGINIFPHHAVPVSLDHRAPEYPVTPSEHLDRPCQIYSIEKITGLSDDKKISVVFSEFHRFSSEESPHYYREKIRRHPLTGKTDLSITLAYEKSRPLPPVQSLSFDILCSNGDEADHLPEGHIHKIQTGVSESITVKNIMKTTVSALPPMGNQALWRLTSLLSLNMLSLKRLEDLQSLLRLFVAEGYRDRLNARICEHKIRGVTGFEIRSVDRLVGGILIRGLEMRLTVSRSHFAGMGDVYLFGTVMSRFFGMYAAINTFTRLTIHETDSGETLEWKERMGRQLLQNM